MKKDPIERFFSKVDKTDSCWNWLGMKDRDGYGLFQFEGKQWRAHRFSFSRNQSVNGIVCHTCNNRACVNPAHMYLGDAKTNALDLAKFGDRSRWWLTDDQVKFIRSSSLKSKVLADMFSVPYYTIWNCRVGNTYKHIS